MSWAEVQHEREMRLWKDRNKEMESPVMRSKWGNFALGVLMALAACFFIDLGFQWVDNIKAAKAKEDSVASEMYKTDGLPHPCSTTFEYLTCYYRNGMHYEVSNQDSSERESNAAFIKDHSCKLWITVPQENKFDPDRNFIHIRPALDSYDCKQFGRIYLYRAEVEFPK